VNNERGIEHKNGKVDETFLDSVEEWGKKEKQHKHLQPKNYRPFKESPSVKFTDSMIDNYITIVDEQCVGESDYTRQSYFSTPGSHRSPLDIEHSCEMELYRNRLPKDLTYYRSVKMPKTNNYVVGHYGYLSDLIFNEITFRDFNTLSDERWLNNFVIDICLALKVYELRLNNVQVLQCEIVQKLMEKRDVGKNKDGKFQKILFEENKIVVLPWNVNGNHWIIAIIDFNKKECIIMDPYRPKDIHNTLCTDRFIELSSRMEENGVYGEKKDFPLLNFIQCPMKNIPVQNDIYNCGVFIIYYMFTIISDSNFDPMFSPDEYRFCLKKYLLKKSENMTEVCLYCNRMSNVHRCEEDQNRVDWVSCTRCGRWVALNCIPKRDRVENYEKIIFLCMLCQ
jgi:hypothetical protein